MTARSGLVLFAEYNHGIGLRELADKYLPVPGSNRGFKPSVFVNTLVLMLQGGGRSLEDIRELKADEGLMKLIDSEDIPDPDTAVDWLRRMGDLETGHLTSGLLALELKKLKTLPDYIYITHCKPMCIEKR